VPKITIEVSDTVYKLLQVLEPEGTVEGVLLTLADHAQQGVYRPGSWGARLAHPGLRLGLDRKT